MALFARRENPPVESNYRGYKPFLRRDFLVQCAYCERTEEYLGGEEASEVEHFKPKSKFPDLICAYDNLYYVCRGCNGHKWETWPSQVQIARGQRFADPCVEDPYVHHLRERDEDGAVEELTACGIYSNRHIRLDRPALRRWRRLRSEALRDLPKLTGIARMLEQVVASSERPDRDEAAERLGALSRSIEESKVRFSIG
jgi:5-methylcytosine-specific restriction endonuclease McrA